MVTGRTGQRASWWTVQPFSHHQPVTEFSLALQGLLQWRLFLLNPDWEASRSLMSVSLPHHPPTCTGAPAAGETPCPGGCQGRILWGSGGTRPRPMTRTPPAPVLGSAVLPVVQLQSLFDSGGQALTNAVSKQGIFAQDDSDTQIFLCCLPEL